MRDRPSMRAASSPIASHVDPLVLATLCIPGLSASEEGPAIIQLGLEMYTFTPSTPAKGP